MLWLVWLLQLSPFLNSTNFYQNIIYLFFYIYRSSTNFYQNITFISIYVYLNMCLTSIHFIYLLDKISDTFKIKVFEIKILMSQNDFTNSFNLTLWWCMKFGQWVSEHEKEWNKTCWRRKKEHGHSKKQGLIKWVTCKGTKKQSYLDLVCLLTFFPISRGQGLDWMRNKTRLYIIKRREDLSLVVVQVFYHFLIRMVWNSLA